MNIKDLFKPQIVLRINHTDHEERAHLGVHSSGVVVDTCFRYLALICSSSDLELDHWCLQLNMKGTAVFCSKQIVSSQSTELGGNRIHLWACCVPTCILTRVCVCVSLWSYLIGQMILRVKPGTDREDCWPTQLHVQRLFTGHLLSQPFTTVYCLAKWELYSLIKVTG